MLFSSLFKSAFVASMATAALAQGHVHNEHKRDVVVVTQYQTVVVTASVNQVVAGADGTVTFSTLNTALAAPTSLSSTISKEQQVIQSASTVAPASQATTSAASQSPATSSTQASAPASSSSSSSSSSFSSGKGITYSPYTSSGACKSLSEVQADLAKLSGYEIIRLYGVDCSQVENVLQAKAKGQKLFLGIFFVDAIEAGISQIAAAIKQYGSWSDVYTVSIGNELVNSGAASVSQVAQYVSTGRAALTAAGYTGPVVSVDTHIATINNPGLCALSDYIAINAHAYFDENTLAENAGEWLLLQIQRVWTACGGKKSVFVTESGWPHQGETYGVAIASPQAQAAAISSLKQSVSDSVILFTAFDDLWKADGFLGCEKYWGFIN